MLSAMPLATAFAATITENCQKLREVRGHVWAAAGVMLVAGAQGVVVATIQAERVPVLHELQYTSNIFLALLLQMFTGKIRRHVESMRNNILPAPGSPPSDSVRAFVAADSDTEIQDRQRPVNPI